MNNLEKEAKEYASNKQLCSNHIYDKISSYEGYIACVNSNYVKQEIIKAKIEMLFELHKENRPNVNLSITCLKKIEIYQLELKQIETPKI